MKRGEGGWKADHPGPEMSKKKKKIFFLGRYETPTVEKEKFFLSPKKI